MRVPQDIKIGEYTLKEILERHMHWLDEDCEGWESMCADLNGADLSYVDLRGADLSYANLRGADLHDVNLCSADLSYADLSNANLHNAKLHDAILYNAYMAHVDLSNVNLYGAILRGANLCDADLYGADLLNVDLTDANLYNVILSDANGKLVEYRKGKILSESIIGYKKCKDDIIVTLEIPRGAIVFSINGSNCRTNKAKVIDIEGADRAYSKYSNMSYYIGDEINIYNFNCEYNIECAEGVHFFMTKEEAENLEI